MTTRSFLIEDSREAEGRWHLVEELSDYSRQLVCKFTTRREAQRYLDLIVKVRGL